MFCSPSHIRREDRSSTVTTYRVSSSSSARSARACSTALGRVVPALPVGLPVCGALGVGAGVEGRLGEAVGPPSGAGGAPAEHGPGSPGGPGGHKGGGGDDHLGLAGLSLAPVLLPHVDADVGDAVDRVTGLLRPQGVGDAVVDDAEGAAEVEEGHLGGVVLRLGRDDALVVPAPEVLVGHAEVREDGLCLGFGVEIVEASSGRRPRHRMPWGPQSRTRLRRARRPGNGARHRSPPVPLPAVGGSGPEEAGSVVKHRGDLIAVQAELLAVARVESLGGQAEALAEGVEHPQPGLVPVPQAGDLQLLEACGLDGSEDRLGRRGSRCPGANRVRPVQLRVLLAFRLPALILRLPALVSLGMFSGSVGRCGRLMSTSRISRGSAWPAKTLVKCWCRSLRWCMPGPVPMGKE